jgi:hypothetical protein
VDTRQARPARQSSRLRWYQFRLRTLLILVVVVAAFCSLGASTHWVVPVGIATSVVIGGATGGLVGRTWPGIVVGAMYGLQFAVIPAGLVYVSAVLAFSRAPWLLYLSVVIAAAFAAALGGGLGGLAVRSRYREPVVGSCRKSGSSDRDQRPPCCDG